MAAIILSQDFLSICLILSEGDTGKNLEQIILEAERFQETANRHFGTDQYDLRLLIINLDILRFMEQGAREETLLKEIIPDILSFNDALCCDTEADWCGHPPMPEKNVEEYEELNIEYWMGYSKEEFARKIELKRRMVDFFSNPQNHQPELIAEFMKNEGIDKSLLYSCSRPGPSH